MAQFDKQIAEQKLAEMIAQHQDVADGMTPDKIENWSDVSMDPNHRWLDGMIKHYGLPREDTIKAACCFSFQLGVEESMALYGKPDGDLPASFWGEPENYRAHCEAFCIALGALVPFVGKGLQVRTEYTL